MTPILFSDAATTFNTQGIGALADALSCYVTEELNGQYELEMEYPVTGQRYKDIKNRCLIYCNPDPYRAAQPFRIYRITKPLNGIITVYARHISYDLAGIPINPFSAPNVAAALQGLLGNAATPCPFTFWTNKTTVADFLVKVPTVCRSLLGGNEGSILDVYGGEYEWDGFTVRLWNQRGSNNGVRIAYGKNLTDISQDENISNLATGVIGYWTNPDGETVQGPLVNAPGNYNFTHVITVDFSQDFEEQPTTQQLQQRTQQYIDDNDIGIPEVSIEISWVQLEQYSGYEGMSLLERVSLGDTVMVDFPPLGVAATARVVKTKYNPILNRYESAEVGSIQANLANTIANQQQQINNKPGASQIEQIANAITQAILGAKGGSVRLLDTNGDGEPDTLYIADNPDPTQAVKVWRFNYQGWGASTHGYNGPFEMSAALGIGMYADFIAAGTLNAALVNVINLNASNIVSGTIDASKISVINLNARNITSGYIDAAQIQVYNLNANNLVAGAINCDNILVYNINASNISTGTIDASKISVTNLNADNIKAGTLKAIMISSNDGSSWWNLQNGQAVLNQITANGTLDSTDGSIRSSVRNGGFYSYANEQICSAIYGYTESGQDMGSARFWGQTNSGGRAVFAVLRAQTDGGAFALTDASGTQVIQMENGLIQGERLGITGEKNRIVSTSYGRIKMHSLETPQPRFEDFGTGACDENGLCVLTLDPRFEETVSRRQPPIWQVTPTAPGALWVENGPPAVVHGQPGQTFNWSVSAPQIGYEEQYADPWDELSVYNSDGQNVPLPI